MLGNAISVPHALLCLVNGLGLMSLTEWHETPQSILSEAFRGFLSASKQEVLVDVVARTMDIRMFQVSPTLPWTCDTVTYAKWLIPTGPWYQFILVQPGVEVAEALRSLFPKATGSSITWRSSRRRDVSPVSTETPVCTFVDHTTWVEDDGGWFIQAPYEILFDYFRFAGKIGLLDLVQRLGWFMAIQPARHDSLDMPKMVFRRRTEVPGVDPMTVRTLASTIIAQALFPPDIPTREQLVVQIKFRHTWSREYTWHLNTTVNDILQPWSRATRHTGCQSEMRALYAGKQMSNEFRIRSYRTQASDTATMRIHFVLQQRGGGNKLEAHQKVKQAMVEFLLQSGGSPLGVNEHVRNLFEKGGTSRMQHILQIRDEDERLAQFQRIAHALKVTPLDFEHPEKERMKKLRAWKPKALPPHAAVKASDFELTHGHFVQSDGTPSPVLTFPNQEPEGIMLIDATDCDEHFRSMTTKHDSRYPWHRVSMAGVLLSGCPRPGKRPSRGSCGP